MGKRALCLLLSVVLLLSCVDYKVSYENNTQAGTAVAVITGMGDYSGEKRINFKITGTSIVKAKVEGLESTLIYTGEKIEQNCNLTASVNGTTKKLTAGTDYTVSYQNNKNAGTATVIFTGINGYSGTLKKKFKIKAYNIKEDTQKSLQIEENIVAAYAKGGSKPKPIVTFKGTVLTEGVDYKLSYKNNKAVNDGTDAKKQPTVTITGEYRIVQADMKKASVKVAAQTYTGSEIEPDKTQITIKMGKVTLADTDYEIVSYSNNVKKGTAKVVLKGVGNYGGTKTVKFKIKSKGFIWWFRNLF